LDTQNATLDQMLGPLSLSLLLSGWHQWGHWLESWSDLSSC